MTLSVLMSVYHKDNPSFLDEALSSIWDTQTRKPDQIVIIEDGPLNNELYVILNKWTNNIGEALKRVPLITNNGLTKALNIGIEYCNSDYIARMDSDDRSSSSRFEKQIDFLLNNENIVALGGAIQEYNRDNDNICIRSYPLDSIHAKKFIAKASPMAHAAVMFRRKIFDKGIRYNEKFRTSQDLELWFQLLKGNHEIANIPDVIYYVRVSDDFFERRSKDKAINEFKIYWNGILDLHGISFKLFYPIARIIFRLTPKFIIKAIYHGMLRRVILKK